VSFEPFEQLLKRTMGLDAASIGTTTVERAVLARIAISGLLDPSTYWSLILSSPAELQELIEAVIVAETWFFRDREAFAALARLVPTAWYDLARAPVRIASLPCATGEEPYSIAMALLEGGFAPARLDIRGIDISERALSRARHGVYGRNSFRGGDLSFRERWFSLGSDGYLISDAVRGCVRFDQANLFDPGFPLRSGSCDIVFCRNLLIYFDGPTQTRAVAMLAKLLTPDGVLFVGPSETSLLIDQGFESVRIPLAFAFRKASASSVQPAPARRLPPPRGRVRHAFSAAARAVTEPPELQPNGIDEIRRLADLGRLDEAAQHCETLLRKDGASAEPLYLLGLIRDAGDDRSRAVAAYRKALYLDPDHRGALEQLAALLESEGDGRGARVLGERLRRLDRRS
jgi:chemotaxis protein methyltransferase WspC